MFLKEVFLSFFSCFHSILQIIKVGVEGPPAVRSSSLKGQWCIVERMSRMDREDFMIHLFSSSSVVTKQKGFCQDQYVKQEETSVR